MQTVRKKLITDDNHHPIAVQIDYKDWLQIEQHLDITETTSNPIDLSRHAGTLSLKESPLSYQARCRSEWP